MKKKKKVDRKKKEKEKKIIKRKKKKKRNTKKKGKKRKGTKKKKENCPIFFKGTIYLFTDVIFDNIHARNFCFHLRELPKISRAKRDFHAHF